MSRNIDPTKLRSVRLERGLTQQDVAEAAGLSVRTLQRAGRGRQARADTVMRVADVLQISPDELRERERPPSPSLLTRQVGGHVVLVASTKGGTGRTTLAISIAGLLQEEGHSVCLLDFHKHRGVSFYVAWAQALRRPVPTHVLEKSPAEAARRLAGLRQAFDHVVIDASAYEDTELIPLALMADQVLLTTDNAAMDFSITQRVKMWLSVTIPILDKISIVQTRASRYNRHRRDDSAFLRTIGLPVCKTVLRRRSSYEYALARGDVVTVDDPDGHAAAEISQLCHELGWINHVRPRTIRDRRRTKDDRVYFRASMRLSCLPTLLAQVGKRRR